MDLGGNRSEKLVESWLDHKSSQYKWRRYWCVLKRKTIYIFSNRETIKENHVGTLTVEANAQFNVHGGDPNKGYKFELHTGGRSNTFKATKFNERELWRAYIIGLAKGTLPSDLDLLPGQAADVKERLNCVWQAESQMPATLRPLPIPAQPDSASIQTGFSDPNSSIEDNFSSGQASLDIGGPLIRHKFFLDSSRSDDPSWFFANCTRDTAERILSQCSKFGNTLMRESFTFRDTGSYVISKKMDFKQNIDHFEVIRVAKGFKINVENAHEPMVCLSEVMEFFVQLSGPASTRPLTSNCLRELGLEDQTADYQHRIPNEETEKYENPVANSGRRQSWAPATLSKPKNQDQPAEDIYDVLGEAPSIPPSQHPRWQKRSVSTPNIFPDFGSKMNLATKVGIPKKVPGIVKHDGHSSSEDGVTSQSDFSLSASRNPGKCAPAVAPKPKKVPINDIASGHEGQPQTENTVSPGILGAELKQKFEKLFGNTVPRSRSAKSPTIPEQRQTTQDPIYQNSDVTGD